MLAPLARGGEVRAHVLAPGSAHARGRLGIAQLDAASELEGAGRVGSRCTAFVHGGGTLQWPRQGAGAFVTRQTRTITGTCAIAPRGGDYP